MAELEERRRVPVIGITTARGRRPTAGLQRVREAGGSPLVRHIGPGSAILRSRLDRLLLIDGAGAQPALLGATVDPEAGVVTDLPRDELEMGLLGRALEEAPPRSRYLPRSPAPQRGPGREVHPGHPPFPGQT